MQGGEEVVSEGIMNRGGNGAVGGNKGEVKESLGQIISDDRVSSSRR